MFIKQVMLAAFSLVFFLLVTIQEARSAVENVGVKTAWQSRADTLKPLSKKPKGKKLAVEPVKATTEKRSSDWKEAYYSGEAMKIGNAVQYLFDDYIVEDRFGLKRVLGEVKKYEGNPLSMGENTTWEKKTESWSGAYVNHVIYDPKDKIYKGWYLVYRHDTGYNYSTLYAESNDGIHWKKPLLDFFKMDGERTNYVLHDEKDTALMQDVSLDADAKDPERRFTALVKMVPPGEKVRCIVRMFSPDGKKWTLAPDPILFRGANDGSYSLVADKERDRWLLYRRPATNAVVSGGEGVFGAKSPLNPEKIGVNAKRRVGVTISKDMKKWSYPRGIAVLDELDDAQVQILGNGMDIDWTTVTKVNDVFFGFLHIMDNLTMTNPRQNHLMWSRDGIDWKRLPQRPQFIQNGAPGEWDAGSIGSISLLTEGDQYRIYYTGGNTSQGEKRFPRFTANGMAYLGKDRFVGQQAGPAGGYLLTREFVLEGNRLEVNFSSQVKTPPAEWGRVIRAEILQAPDDQVAATVIRGFSIKDCDPITSQDSFSTTLSWKGSSDLSALKGKKVYIRFYIQNTTLYTFRIAD